MTHKQLAEAGRMSKYKARKLIKELKIEVGRLNRVIELSTESRRNILQLMELMKSDIINTL